MEKGNLENFTQTNGNSIEKSVNTYVNMAISSVISVCLLSSFLEKNNDTKELTTYNGRLELKSNIDDSKSEIYTENYNKKFLVKEVKKLKSFDAFKYALGKRESGNNYNAVNSLGYVGKYQFGVLAARDLKTTRKKLLKSPKMQEDAIDNLCSINLFRLRKYSNQFEGNMINGIEVTESGLIAGAHLLGADNVKKWLNTRGRINPSDANGTHIEEYIENFAGYEVDVEMKRKHDMSEY